MMADKDGGYTRPLERGVRAERSIPPYHRTHLKSSLFWGRAARFSTLTPSPLSERLN